MLEHALAYAARGKRVFPCNGENRPIPRHGSKHVATDAAQIRAWWEKQPHAGMAMPTGQITGLSVLDIDNKPDKGKVGDEALELLENKHGALPDTPTVLTPSGGEHRYFE